MDTRLLGLGTSSWLPQWPEHPSRWHCPASEEVSAEDSWRTQSSEQPSHPWFVSGLLETLGFLPFYSRSSLWKSFTAVQALGSFVDNPPCSAHTPLLHGHLPSAHPLPGSKEGSGPLVPDCPERLQGRVRSQVHKPQEPLGSGEKERERPEVQGQAVTPHMTQARLS